MARKNPFKIKTRMHEKRYPDHPKEFDLSDFLLQHIEEAEQGAEIDERDRELKQTYREHREDCKPNTYAIAPTKEKKKDKKRAFLVIIDDRMFVAFAETKEKAKWQAVKYFRDNFYPGFTTEKEYSAKLKGGTKNKRIPALDKYADEGKIPIPALLEVGFELSCTSCGKDNFTYEDYKNERCFVVEEDVDMNVYTRGVILCYSCYKRLIGEEHEE